MKPEHQLKLLRLSLHLNTEKAAQYLAARPDRPDGVSETTWLRWENGKKEIPDDVMEHLNAIRSELAAYLNDGCLKRAESDVLAPYFRLAGEVFAYVCKEGGSENG